MSHLDEGTIHAWLDGALPADEAAHVEAHARACAECAALVAEARGFVAGASRIVSSLDVVPGNVIPATPMPASTAPGSLWRRLKLTPARAAIAATILVGVASMLSVRHRDFESAARDEIGAKAAAPVTEPAAVPTAPSAVSGASASSSAPASAPVAPPVSRKASPPAPASTPSVVPTAAADTVAAVREAKAAADAERRDLAARQPTLEPAVSAVTAGRAAESVQLNQAARRYAPAAAGAAPRAAMTADRVTTAEGCYAIDGPPAGVDLRGLPARFQLARDSSNAGVVRRIELVGGAGRPVDGASWRMQAGGMVVITMKGAEARGALELRFLVGGTTLRVTEGGRESTMRLTRVECGG